MQSVERPVWRTYLPHYVNNAAEHVRRGGHAVVRDARAWRVVVPSDEQGGVRELSAWALMDLGATVMDVPQDGPLAGLVVVRIPARLRPMVSAWCERDATQRESTVVVSLDCRACAACCRHNRVVLGDEDLARWRDAGRSDLAGLPYVRSARGATVLRVLRGGDCVHLRDNDCGIYALRPDNCRDFPAGSEQCLSARSEAGHTLSLPG